MAATYPTFGPYILFKKVLADELGHLYRAGELVKGSLGRTVWLRVFDGAAVPRGDLGARLADANRVGEVLQAANVAAHSRFSSHDGVAGNAWDYAPGQPLTAVFRKVREEGFPVPVDNALLIMEKLSLALSAALAVDMRGASLVHGFLHPGTIIITNDGEGLVSGFVAGGSLLGVLENAAAFTACAPYLAPEVLTSRTPSSRGDVYSLGAILFHLLTSKALPAEPEQRRESVSGARLEFDEEPVPKDIMAVLTRALADRPEDRFSSAADFKQELDKLLYGGPYSPTTFNLALFMDRLFRSEIEAEENERTAEAELDVAPYVRPEPKVEEVVDVPPPTGGTSKGLWIGLAAAVVVAAALGGWLMFGRGPTPPPPAPTPTAEQLVAQRQAQQAQVQAIVEQQVAQMLAEREKEIRKELTDRQAEIDRLNKRLKSMETGGSANASSRQQQEQIKRQIAAAEKAKQDQEKALEQERQKALEEAKRRVEPTAVPSPAVAAALPPEPTSQPTLVPVATATPAPPTPAPAVREGEIVTAGPQVKPPVVIKQIAPTYPPVARRMQLSGEVNLRVLVGPDGSVEKVEILQVTRQGAGFEKAAEDAVREWRFRPATKAGVKVRFWVPIRIPFRLQ
jgi:TonB family protein